MEWDVYWKQDQVSEFYTWLPNNFYLNRKPKNFKFLREINIT